MINKNYIIHKMNLYSPTKFRFWLYMYLTFEDKYDKEIPLNKTNIKIICEDLKLSFQGFWDIIKSFGKYDNQVKKNNKEKIYYFIIDKDENFTYKNPYEKKKEFIEKYLSKFNSIEKSSGIYAICADETVLYVGKSIHIGQRFAEHLYEIENLNENSEKKYKLLKELKDKKIPLNFKILEESLFNLDSLEKHWIKETNPILNTQIPKGDDSESKFYVRSIEDLTVDKILNFLEKERNKK